MNFHQFINIIFWRKKIAFLVLSVLVSSTVLISFLLPKQYVATASIVIDQRTVDPLTGMALPIQLLPGYIATQVDIISSHNVARKVVEKLKLADNPQIQEDFAVTESKVSIVDWLADSFQKKLDVKPSRESSLIEVSFTAVDPQFAAIIANAFADGYIQASVELRSQPAKLSADWFDQQMLSLRERLERAQAKLSSYQQQYGIVATDDRLDIETSRLIDLSRQLVESQAKTDELQSRKNLLNISHKAQNSNDSLQEVLNSSLIGSLKAELATKEANFAQLSKRYDKNHPQYKQAEAEINSLQQRINAEIKSVQNSMHSGLESSKQRDEILAKDLAEQKAKVLELRKQHDEIAVLSHEVENEQRTYDTAMQRTVQTRMESELSHTNISILNPAIPPATPAKPKIVLNILISIFMGGVLGIGSAFLLEMLDRKVRSALDISENLDLPVLAVLPAAVPNSKLKVSNKKIKKLWRPFRTIDQPS